ncbi:TIGR02302 family protein, partial [uncultured Methylobacterium sp.]|uniref:TIGR02302 family protein n=1 Tax=uncultured Methylobacterium sp. TaxID=157278 RepID=UPI0035C9DE2A
MGEADDRMTPVGSGDDTLRVRLDRLVARANAALVWERAWPVLWRGLAVVLAFLAVSWLGLWLDLGPGGRMAGLALFTVAFAAALLPLARMGRPSRREALARIDRDAAGRSGVARDLAHDPASAIEDTLAVGTGNPETQALWALHRRRAAAAVSRLKVAAPRPAMPRRDPLALRAAILVTAAASLFVAGTEWRQRIGSAFDWRAPPAASPSFRVDGWIDPPLYTRMPPLVVTLAGGDQRLRAPVNSTLIVRIAGQGEAKLTAHAGLQALPGKDPRPDLREDRFKLTGGIADLTVETTGAAPQRLIVETIPDQAPVIRSVGTPEVNGRGTFNLSYRASDDYGVASAEGVVEALKPGRALVPPPRIPLALPSDASGETDTKTLVDLTDHPWSGARVRFTLAVKDEADQGARGQSVEMTLPARPFQKPLARALAEERRRLVTAPDESRSRVQTALDALMIAPDRFTPELSIFLGLRTASRRLKAARSDEALIEVADLLWEMALKIEDGDLSDAEKSLRAAQDKLKEAIERNAPDEEVKQLTEDLKQALDKFMKEMAQRQGKEPQKQGDRGQQKNAKSVTPDDLNKMIEDMADAMKRGDTAEAQRLLEQLRGILENLQSAEQGGKSDPRNREMSKQAEELDEMAREQQGLRDDTFKDGQSKRGQRQPRNGQQGQQQPGGQGQQ